MMPPNSSGWPEAQIPLAEATIYIATANQKAIPPSARHRRAALEDVKSGRTLAVPEHLRDAPLQRRRNASAHGPGLRLRPTTIPTTSWRKITSAPPKRYYQPHRPGP